MGNKRHIPKDQQGLEELLDGSRAATTHKRAAELREVVFGESGGGGGGTFPTLAELYGPPGAPMMKVIWGPAPDPVEVHGPEVRRLMTQDFVFSSEEALENILSEIRGQKTPEARMKAAGEWITRFTNAVSDITREDD